MNNSADNQGSSTRPYLLRALHDWCTDNGFTPYLAVYVDGSVQVPMEYVKNNEIVLNVGFEATSGLKLGNEFIEFKARFGGTSREIVVPVDHVVAIYARENGQGMAFPVPTETASRPVSPLPRGLRLARGEQADEATDEADPAATVEPLPLPAAEPPQGPDSSGGASAGGRPALKRVK